MERVFKVNLIFFLARIAAGKVLRIIIVFY